MRYRNKEVLLYSANVARLGCWVVGSLADGPDYYTAHVEDIYQCVAELRKL